MTPAAPVTNYLVSKWPMHRLLTSLILVCIALPSIAVGRLATAAPPTARVSGTIIGYDNTTALIAINSRLGRRSFLVNAGTLVLLNNHSAARTDIQIGDDATITFEYSTSTATTIHLFRTASRTGTVGTVAATSVQLRLSRQANLTFQANAATVTDVEGIPLDQRGVLAGVRAKAVFEPGSLLLLKLRATSKLASGAIVTVNDEADTLTIAGRRDLAFAVDPLATIRRAGATATLADLAVDDDVRVAYVKEGAALRALAIEATPTSAD